MAGGPSAAPKKLKAKSGWDNDRNGTDDYGFSALPGGQGYFDSDGAWSFNYSDAGYWWTSTENVDGDGGDKAYAMSIGIYIGYPDQYKMDELPKNQVNSVRCVQDAK